MTEPAEAEKLIFEKMPRRPAARVPIAEAAGHALCEPIDAERDQPPFDRVTMDGIAIRLSDWETGIRAFRIAATQAAGAPATALPGEAQCIEVMTGAMLPDGADTVVPVERLEVRDGSATIAADAPIANGQFVHYRGSDRRAGDRLLEAGTLLGPAEIAVLASAGHGRVLVAETPEVAVISTGDELVDVEGPIEPYQIRSCNDFAIAASLERAGLAQVTRTTLRDDPGEILAAVQRLHAASDALILSGGVSMGQFDFVPAALETLGCTVVFHRINQKPGRPMWFGTSRDGKPVFALPGNPVSTLLCMTRYVLPAFRVAAGLPPSAGEHYPLESTVSGPRDMTYFVPVTLRWDTDGAGRAVPHPTNTSGDFATLTRTAGFLELAPGSGAHPAGTVGRLHRWWPHEP